MGDNVSDKFIKSKSSAIYRLLHPQMTVLVACQDDDVQNVMAASWCMPVSFDPPMVAVSISPRRFSYSIISKTGEFTVNIPSKELLEAVKYCGSVSGKDVRNKIEEAGLTILNSEKVKAPLIAECVAALECKVVKAVEAGDHVVFIGKIVSVHVKRGYFNETYTEIFKPILHMGSDLYYTIGDRIE